MDWEDVAAIGLVCVAAIALLWMFINFASNAYSIQDYYYADKHYYIVHRHGNKTLLLEEVPDDEKPKDWRPAA